MKIINSTDWINLDITVEIIPYDFFNYKNNIRYKCVCGRIYEDDYNYKGIISKKYKICENCGKKNIILYRRK